jgi:hypothetical protein
MDKSKNGGIGDHGSRFFPVLMKDSDEFSDTKPGTGRKGIVGSVRDTSLWTAAD